MSTFSCVDFDEALLTIDWCVPFLSCEYIWQLTARPTSTNLRNPTLLQMILSDGKATCQPELSDEWVITRQWRNHFSIYMRYFQWNRYDRVFFNLMILFQILVCVPL